MKSVIADSARAHELAISQDISHQKLSAVLCVMPVCVMPIGIDGKGTFLQSFSNINKSNINKSIQS